MGVMVCVHNRHVIFSGVVILCTLFHHARGNLQLPYCKSKIETDFGLCGSRPGERTRMRGRGDNKLTQIPDIDEMESGNNSTCIYSGVCRRLFYVGRIYRVSFGLTLSIEVSQMLKRCCGNCTKYHQTDLLPPLQEANKSVVDNLDIIYPTYAPPSAELVQGFYFIPVINVPSAFYFTLQKSEKEMAQEIIFGCLQMWPLLLMCLLMSLIAGFFMWLLDTWANRKEFPRSFPAGFREGFWWSFISMTTVGYGDKSPKSLSGRIFAVVWILIGITLTSIYIASLASQVMTVKEPVISHMRGMKVGALKNRLYDSLMIAQHGGILQEMDFNSTFVGIVNLVKQLRGREIDGFLVSRTSYYYFSRLMEEDPTLGGDIRDVALRKTEKNFVGDYLVAGMLVKNHEDYHYFREYFRSNWPHIQGCYSYDLNYKDKKFVTDAPNPLKGLFLPFFIGCIVVLVVLVLFGVVYEYIRRKHCNEWDADKRETAEQSEETAEALAE